MFYEVRVYDSNNHVKKIIQTKELKKRHWVNFWQEQTKKILPEISKKKSEILKPKKAS